MRPSAAVGRHCTAGRPEEVELAAGGAVVVGGLLKQVGVSESARADSRSAVRVQLDVEDHVVRMRSISRKHRRHSGDSGSELVEAQCVARAPSDHVISAGGVPTDPEAADFHAIHVDAEAAAEHVDAADALANHRILSRAEGCGVNWGRINRAQPRLVAVGDVGIHRIAVLQPIQASARLHCRKEIGGRQGESLPAKALPAGELVKLKAFAVFAFCAAMTRLPSHCDV